MKVYLDMVGCRLNQSEIETFARQFRSVGHSVVPTPEEADLVVINTCTVTHKADADSRKKIRQAARAGVEKIVVTGCWATLQPHLAATLPNVQLVVPNQEKECLVPQILHLPPESFDLEPLIREPLPGARRKTRAFIKVQDGCDNRCTFCITTIARGASRSRLVEEVLADVQAAINGGTQEVVLTGVHLGSWGHDLHPPRHLKDLIQTLLHHTDILRLRLSSLEPWDLDEDFFELWADQRLCRHLHLPLQSGSRVVLRRMARKTTPEAYRRLIAIARAAIPEVAITTDIIVGFPGESETEFARSLEFVAQMEFARGHVFAFSPRPGTAAAHMPDQVPQSTRQERSARMRVVFRKSAEAFRSRFLGQTVSVLWEAASGYGPEGWQMSGLTDNYLRVTACTPENIWNRITRVRLTKVTEKGLSGVVESNPQGGIT
jgi:threonylcarbamoyladenosine tRNA methylthiotransferase MtaB